MKAKKSKSNIKILVKCEFDWADEMDVYGFSTFEPREWEYVCKEINAIEYPIDWYVGTNEEITFDSADDIFRGFDVSVLTSEETEIIERRFVKYGEYGQTPFGVLQGNAPESFYDENGSLSEYLKKG